jgi:hypothetical protein
MASALPKVKKSISSFLTEEEGRISKRNLYSLGALLSGYAFSSLIAKPATSWHTNHSSHSSHASHSNNPYDHSQSAAGIHYSGSTIKAVHSHYDPAHANHDSHNSHGSHCSSH